jgi:hypothetical protein
MKLTKADDTEWKVYRKEWYNDRIMETYINAPIIDKQNDLIPTNVMEKAMDFYMKYGIYSYQHDELPIGLPLAYKVEDGKVKVRYGIHNQMEMHDNVWDEIKDMGTKGASSIRGETLQQDMVCPEGANSCFNKINDLGLWSVSWVGDNPANVEASVTEVALAKADNTESFINNSQQMTSMAKVKKDCGHDSKKAEDCGCNEAVEEVKAEEVTVEVISPEELPDVIAEESETEEEEKAEEEAEELTLEMLAEEMKSLKMKLEEMALPAEEEKTEEEEEVEAEKSDIPLDLVMKSLKKHGISVYAGTKATPAPAVEAPKVNIDWNKVTKSWDELDAMEGE